MNPIHVHITKPKTATVQTSVQQPKTAQVMYMPRTVTNARTIRNEANTLSFQLMYISISTRPMATSLLEQYPLNKSHKQQHAVIRTLCRRGFSRPEPTRSGRNCTFAIPNSHAGHRIHRGSNFWLRQLPAVCSPKKTSIIYHLYFPVQEKEGTKCRTPPINTILLLDQCSLHTVRLQILSSYNYCCTTTVSCLPWSGSPNCNTHRSCSSGVDEGGELKGEDMVEAGGGDEAEAGGAAKAPLNPGLTLPLSGRCAGRNIEHRRIATTRRHPESWIARPPDSACIGCGRISRPQPESGIVRPTGSDTRLHGRSSSPQQR